MFLHIEDAHGARHRRPQHFWRVSADEAWHSWHMIWCGSFCLVVLVFRWFRCFRRSRLFYWRCQVLQRKRSRE